MTNFRDVNYLINVLVRSNINLKKSVSDSKETYVVLKKFNGSFTNKESIEETRYPGLGVYDKVLDDGKRHLVIKQLFIRLMLKVVNIVKA